MDFCVDNNNQNCHLDCNEMEIMTDINAINLITNSEVFHKEYIRIFVQINFIDPNIFVYSFVSHKYIRIFVHIIFLYGLLLTSIGIWSLSDHSIEDANLRVLTHNFIILGFIIVIIIMIGMTVIIMMMTMMVTWQRKTVTRRAVLAG